ncbi:g3215 [Coccomyxa viridis]|uniref:G3215 protein n=1 Tax=Coccomyxa viridis TaxID=1274662 RepID=A0ABP1FM88_9CHLO
MTVCGQKKQELEPLHVVKLASAALAASLLLSAAVPEDALAARSGGRVGGSSFRSSAPRAAPRAAPAPRSSGPAVRNYNNYYSAPPLVGGYGGYGYGGGGISIMPSFGMPLFYGGGIFNFFVVMFVASAVLGVVRNLASRGRSNDDEFDD